MLETQIDSNYVALWQRHSKRLRRVEFLNLLYLIILPVLIARVMWLEFHVNEINLKVLIIAQSRERYFQNDDPSYEYPGTFSEDQKSFVDDFSTSIVHSNVTHFIEKEENAHDHNIEDSDDVKTETDGTGTHQIAHNVVARPIIDMHQQDSNTVNFNLDHFDSVKERKFQISHNHITRGKFSHDVKTDAQHRDAIGSRKLKSSLCRNFPMLSPVNMFNNFTYDESISRTFDMIYSISSMEAVHKPGTPQYWSACWMMYDDSYQSKVVNRKTIERYVFGLILYSLNNEVEMPTTNICDYDKKILNCTNEGFASQIRLSEAVEMAVIPSEISRFQFLETLDLSSNGLVGTLPTELGNLIHLRTLALHDNHITGTIPFEIGNLNELEFLNLQLNILSGSIPAEIGKCSQLRLLAMDRNLLEGSIPSEIFECKSLKEMSLFLNSLNGTISTRIGQLHDLDTLYVGVNHLSGTIPSEIGNVTTLKYFHADFNQLEGVIPDEIENLNFLLSLWLNNNKLIGNLPDAFGKYQDLFSASLSNNKLSGQIPHSLLELGNIEELHLHRNEMTGTIPNDFCGDRNFEFTSDLFEWFLDSPKVKVRCDCCDRVDCIIWDMDIRPASCSGGISFEYTNTYKITDRISGSSLMNSVGEVTNTANICVSSTGCFELKYYDTQFNEVAFNFSYSNQAQKFIRQEQCETVTICGMPITESDPKRAGLNHLMQIAVSEKILRDPSRSQAKALCWLMTQDQRYHEYSICDGTILQRYVLLVLFFESLPSIDFDDLALKHTCDWQFVKCGLSNKFVREIVVPNKKIVGTLVSELGFLLSLETIDFSSNSFTGPLDSIILKNLVNLQTFDLHDNKFTGTIPEELFVLPRLKHVSLSQNSFIGSISNDTIFSNTFEIIDISSNLLVGQIPQGIVDCPNLMTIDVSQNSLTGPIPLGFGQLKNLKIIKFHMNRLSGSIPVEIFDAKNVQGFFIQSNDLTGIIPNEITNFINASQIALDHNSFQSTIPVGLGNLTQLSMLHLHQNLLTGTAPWLNSSDDSKLSYIVDCGNPAYLLPTNEKILCPTCTICCNSDGMCQENLYFNVFIPTGLLFTVPFMVMLLFYTGSKANVVREAKDPLQIYSEDSVYCFIFTRNYFAWVIHLLTALIQFLLFLVYLNASNLQSDTTDWQFTVRCPGNTLHCKNSSSRSWVGWILFGIVTASFLGADLFQGMMQLHLAIAKRDLRVFFSGFLLLSLTLMAFYASIAYNLGLASTNTDLIMNAVILLFINDLDEKVLTIVETVAPEWAQIRLDEAKDMMESKRFGSEPIASV